MKKHLLYIVIFLIGALAGMWAHRQYHFRDVTKMFQNDTIVRFDTIRYSRLELTTNTCRLDIPKIDNPRMVLVPADSATIIYRDSVRYVTLPRQYYFTETEDAQIWHSGIDSNIDSLVVFRNDMVISKMETTTQTVTKRNALSFGIETSYLNTLSIPIYLEYERMLHKNVGIYGQIFYDLPARQYGVGIGLKMQLEW